MLFSNFRYETLKFFEAQIPKTPGWVGREERLLREVQNGHSGEIQLHSKAIQTSRTANPGRFEKRYESGASSTHSDSSSENEQGFFTLHFPRQKTKCNRYKSTAVK